MASAIIIHGVCDGEEYFDPGYPSSSNSHWIPWLQKQFLIAGMSCQTPEMPKPYAPSYDSWRNTFESVVTSQTRIIVGHSAGCGFALKWLQQNPNQKIDKLILVAPFCDPYKQYGDFISGDIDNSIEERCNKIDLLFSEDEPVKGVRESKDAILKNLSKTQSHIFHDKGHFCFEEMRTVEFPELKDICLRP